MNYRHAFHAGNHADVLKHAVVLFCLEALLRKAKPFAVLDTHAGRGCYDLTSPEAERSPEWRDGIGRLWDWVAPPPLAGRYLEAIHRFNSGGELRQYPGSPLLAAGALRDSDVLMACELHPDEHAALKQALPRSPNVQLHQRDGWEAMGALLPPPQRRGLVLIDPPYEAGGEADRAVAAIAKALRRFAHGVYVWWRPMKNANAFSDADAELAHQGARNLLRAALWVDTPRGEGRLSGSSLLIINPPFGLEDELRAALPPLAQRLSAGEAGWRLETTV